MIRRAERSAMPSKLLASPKKADCDAFERKFIAAGVDDDWCVVGVFGQKLDGVATAVQAFDGDIVADPRDHYLTVTCFMGAAYREQVAIEDARIAHAHAADLQQVIRALFEQGRIERITCLDVLLRKNRAACRDATHQRQRQGQLDCAWQTVALCVRQQLEPDAT